MGTVVLAQTTYSTSSATTLYKADAPGTIVVGSVLLSTVLLGLVLCAKAMRCNSNSSGTAYVRAHAVHTVLLTQSSSSCIGFATDCRGNTVSTVLAR